MKSGPDGMTVDSTTGVLSWVNVAYAANDTVSVSVSDGKASSVFNPQVAMCNCKNGGKTD